MYMYTYMYMYLYMQVGHNGLRTGMVGIINHVQYVGWDGLAVHTRTVHMYL